MIVLNFKKELASVTGKMVLGVRLIFQEGEFATLYGKSGAGKTTLLRILAGLTEPDKGFIKVGSEVWFDSEKKLNLEPQNRKIGFVFQDYALFPNMSVRKNLEYALKSNKDKTIVEELLELVELKKISDRMPDTLSGGQKQRVALARALVRQPQILLLDEPLSALDLDMRLKLQDEILQIHQRFGITTILVSHNMTEIFKLSNRVLIIDEGKIIEDGIPSNIFIGKKISGKFRFEGEVLEIHQSDVIYILTIAIGNNIVKVISTGKEAEKIKIGNKVVIASKAFNPLLLPANYM
jgi:molybdate transport system ATP-binding protein